MSNGRKLLWWTLPVSGDQSAEVGGRMIRNVVIWAGVILALLIVLVVLLTVF